MMNRKLSSAEQILALLVAIFAVVCAYLFFVHFPVQAGLNEAKARQDDANMVIAVSQTLDTKLQAMEAQLELVREDPDRLPLTDYNNATAVVAYLNRLMNKVTDYSLVFHEVEFEENVAVRRIDMTFTCAGYDVLRQVVDELEACPYYCRVIGTAMQAEPGTEDVLSGAISAGLTVVFYEYAGK